jgi:hypothetical protein
MYSGNRILIHGGYDGDLALDDVHIFTLFGFFYMSKIRAVLCEGFYREQFLPEKKVWGIMLTNGSGSWHASCTLSGNRILIHGGYDGDLALDCIMILLPLNVHDACQLLI